MAQQVCVVLSSAEREQLASIAVDRNRPRKHVERAHKLQPHRLRTFKRSRDPSFATKLTDIVGLYIDPPAHAVVLSIMKIARSRRSTAPSPDCRSSRGAARP